MGRFGSIRQIRPVLPLAIGTWFSDIVFIPWANNSLVDKSAAILSLMHNNIVKLKQQHRERSNSSYAAIAVPYISQMFSPVICCQVVAVVT